MSQKSVKHDFGAVEVYLLVGEQPDFDQPIAIRLGEDADLERAFCRHKELTLSDHLVDSRNIVGSAVLNVVIGPDAVGEKEMVSSPILVGNGHPRQEGHDADVTGFGAPKQRFCILA